MNWPRRIGDTRNVCVAITLDRDGLEWLAYALPADDGFTKDLKRILDAVMSEEEEARQFEEEIGRPELRVVFK